MGTPDTSRSAPDIARRILSWYRYNGRPLPWRQTCRPYHILLSEVMLQQTQVSRVEQKYHQFLRLFPTLGSLARAPKRDVVIAWRGLGYNNRAVRLHALAQHLRRRHNGRLPRNINDLIQLPGVGRYTAHAVAAFAFGQQVPVVDVNIRRVLGRIFLKLQGPASGVEESTAWNIAHHVLPAGRAYAWNQALMDLGATICTAGQPRCSECPVAALCASHDVIASLLRQPETGSGGSGRHRRTGPPPRQTRGSGTSRLEVDASRQARLPGPVPARPERSHRGTPLRLYRGRVIEALRNVHPRRSIPAPELGRAILPRFTERDRQVFRRILRALEKDGLIAVRRRGRSGPERVMLA